MKCANCGAEVADGLVYCTVCGKEIIYVPEYNALEDDYLPSIIAGKPESEEDSRPVRRRKRRTTRTKNFFRIFVPAFLGTVLVLCFGSLLFLNSYIFHYQTGKLFDENGDREQAIRYYTRAITRDRTPEVYMARGRDYYRLGLYNYAEEDFLSALLLKPNDPRSYRLLIRLYVKTDDQEALNELYESTDNEQIRDLFGLNRIEPPEFSDVEGVYEEPFDLELTSGEDYVIYYTTDGSDPMTNGWEYDPKEPINIEWGYTKVSAVCKDGDEWGRVVKQKYEVGEGIPKKPKAYPKAGTFHEQIEIALSTSSEDAVIYYSFDGEELTQDSEQYEGPVKLPEGEHELTAIAITEDGVKSAVFRGTYTYDP